MTRISLLLTILLLGCMPKKEKESVEDSADKNSDKLAVEYIEVQQSNRSVSFKGSSLVEPHKKTMVTAKSGGDITSLSLHTGKKVTAKKPVLSVHSSIQKAALDQAKVAFEEAELAYNAMEKLYNKGTISKADFMGAKNRYTAAKMQKISAQKSYRDCFTYPPFTGVVSWYDETLFKGGMIAPGTAVCEITDISKLKLKHFISEKRVVSVQEGDSVVVSVPVLKREFSGIVDAVSPAASAATGAYSLEILFDNDSLASVKGGMRAELELFTSELKQGIQLPTRYLRELNGKNGFYCMDSDTALFKPVSFEIESEESLWVIDGLKEGDKVITSGFSRLTVGKSLIATPKEELN